MDARVKYGLGVAIGVLVLIGAALIWQTRFSPKSTQRQVVKSFLNDPDSAQFRNEYPAPRGEDMWCGEVNARNRMGGMVGFARYVVEVSRDRELAEFVDKLYLEDLHRPLEIGATPSESLVFSGKWAAFCARH